MGVTVEDLAQFLPQPTPRLVPDNIRKAKLRGSLGWGMYALALFLFLFNAIFMYIFFPWRCMEELTLDTGTPAVADGSVITSHTMSMKVNNVRVVKVRFRFTPEGTTEPITGLCYTRGRTLKGNVKVEYSKDNPSIARVKGCLLNPTGYWGALTLLLGIPGVVVLYFAWRGRGRAMSLLQNGTFASGRVVEVQRTNVQVNDQYRYFIFVEFDTPGGARKGRYSAYGEDVSLAQERKENKVPVGVLYNPQFPKQILVADDLLTTK